MEIDSNTSGIPYLSDLPRPGSELKREPEAEEGIESDGTDVPLAAISPLTAAEIGQRLQAIKETIEDEDLDYLSARVPGSLERYLGEMARRRSASGPRRRPVTKQQVVAEALALYCALVPLPPEHEFEF